MHPARKRELLWQGVGWLCYLTGLSVFLLVAVGAYLSVPANSFAGMTPVDLAGLLAGVGLIVLGRWVTFTHGEADLAAGGVWTMGNGPPEQTKLEELGYHVPPDETDVPASGFSYEDGEIRLVCEECGEVNDTEFSYCRNCSAQLPDPG